ncbi:Sec-independent protein translocase protein TatB [Candidatus Methylobacter oryzae]|uniref:Sec-independent protein translocase protein TatB n=1 Tax=Candidatus Methylobacter oryzae TaxID=2497749 RepID=A0ABY3CHC2_9GAMM|nr:Sec-independent protein translocase protein TatB [Candidatus Methylobacter oryzae]TRX03563.1 twin-arginine translocase subunit TatB [Candidatus Methylobacter oryzae]
MFDVGFSELCLIGLVSLLVIGPEKLPKVARLAGFWLGKTRSMVASVKEEIKLELHAEEMRQMFKEQSGLPEVQQILDETSNTLKSTIEPLSMIQNDLDTETVDKVNQHKEPLPIEKAVQHEPK